MPLSLRHFPHLSFLSFRQPKSIKFFYLLPFQFIIFVSLSSFLFRTLISTPFSTFHPHHNTFTSSSVVPSSFLYYSSFLSFFHRLFRTPLYLFFLRFHKSSSHFLIIFPPSFILVYIFPFILSPRTLWSLYSIPCKASFFSLPLLFHTVRTILFFISFLHNFLSTYFYRTFPIFTSSNNLRIFSAPPSRVSSSITT